MSHELEEGLELQSVIGPSDTNGGYVSIRLGSDNHECHEIKVVMQRGHMGMVPWARCAHNNGRVTMVNLALMEVITLHTPEEHRS